MFSVQPMMESIDQEISSLKNSFDNFLEKLANDSDIPVKQLAQ